MGILPKGESETCSGLDCTAYVYATHKLWNGETVAIAPEPIITPDPDPQTTQEPTQEPDPEPEPIENCISQSGATCSVCSGNYTGSDCKSCKTGYTGSSCSTCASGYTSFSSTCVSNNGGCIDASCTQKNFGGQIAYKVGNTSYYAMNPGKSANWDDAQTSCPSGMRVPSKDELVTMNNNSWTGKPSSGFFWSSTEYNTKDAYVMSFPSDLVSDFKYESYGVLCVGN